jgi:hypothetical protein
MPPTDDKREVRELIADFAATILDQLGEKLALAAATLEAEGHEGEYARGYREALRVVADATRTAAAALMADEGTGRR